ncbi:adenosine receptor A3-like [Littorina saxatilis]|uniref:G-protein coupled receptors family 1 profile domain-containing protein n=1 Tax=Littorina saxatilis TaxID=31220 RepID=A0AAN9G6G7_9CAEN
MNVTSRYTTTPILTSRKNIEWDVSRLEGGEELAWWAWLFVEVGVATVIVIGDVSLLMLFFTRKLLGQSTNILVFSVAVADLMAGIMVLPLDVLQRTLSETSGYMCKSYFYFSNVSKTAMVYTVTMLALERIMAALSTTNRILSPGRCLFFSSLTWFFAAAYNIWSVVLYDTRLVGQLHELKGDLAEDVRKGAVAWGVRGGVIAANFSSHVCFASTRFQTLVQIFVVLDFFVTFLFPVVGSVVLFTVFWKGREALRQPGRPYRSSTSVIIFTFALLVSFVLCHFPLEVVALHVQSHDVSAHQDEFLAYKVCQLMSFTRGFWDVFIFGVFRHYVCRKERALAVFRGSAEGRGGSGTSGGGGGGGIEGGGENEPVASRTACLALPNVGARPSVSLLDSDMEVTMTPHRSSTSDHEQ